MQIQPQCSEQTVQLVKKSNLFKILPKEVWVGWVSSAVEAYNMAIYSFIAPAIAMTLFQQSTEASAIFFSYFLVFIGSSFLYPLGAFYYGYVGDKEGRQKTCIYSTLGLGLATGLMGLVPFGLLANNVWIIFLILLCVQYFFSGGEYYGSIVFSLEHSEENTHSQKNQGLMSAFSCLFAVFGLVAANGMAAFSISIEGDMWIKICFLLGGIGGLISYLLKNYCKETAAFTALSKEAHSMDWLSFIQAEWKRVARATMVFAFFMVSYAFIFIFLPLLPFSESVGHNFDTFKSLIVYGIFLVAAGWLSDRIGVYIIMMIGLASFSILILPLCLFCRHLLILQIVLTACACLVIGPIHSWMLQQFDPKHRCRGIFISSALAIALFFGSTVPICLIIFEAFQSIAFSSIYPLVIALIALVCLSKRNLLECGGLTPLSCHRLDDGATKI